MKRHLLEITDDPHTNNSEHWEQVIQTQATPTITDKGGFVLSGTYYPVMYIPPYGKMTGHKTAVIEVVE